MSQNNQNQVPPRPSPTPNSAHQGTRNAPVPKQRPPIPPAPKK